MELQEYIVVDDDDDEEEGGAPLPGFRFHPTDEELVSFYLKRKVEKKPFSFELIKQIDIYTYDPWDLPKAGSSVGEKEWYCYCKRGRKYKNSMRPNRVTRSGGFWKATGIDRPIYDTNVVAGPRGIVGLKKSLVYYRGTSVKGAKTDWMMHEFRLPSQPLSGTNSHLPEPEIWTLCRIFKRSRKYTTPELSSKRGSNNITTNNLSTSAQSTNTKERYISFTTPPTTTTQPQQRPHYNYPDHGIKLVRRQSEEEQMIVENKNNPNVNPNPYDGIKGQWASPILLDHELASNFSSPLNTASSVYDQDQCDYDGNYWENLSSVVDFAITEMYN